MLVYISEFLKNRKSKLHVNSHTSDYVSSETGVPQGSIIAPILFIAYISDMVTAIGQDIKYADDLTAWVTTVDIDAGCLKLEERLDDLNSWCNRWRMTINENKTQILCFNKTQHIEVKIKMKGKELIQVKDAKVVGIVVDENLRFSKHVQHAKEKSLKALYGISRLLDETGGLRTTLGTMLYKSIVFPHLSFGYPVWCTIQESDLLELEEVHRLALRQATGCHASTATNSLEVITGCPLLRTLLNETLVMEYLRVLRKPEDNPLKVIITKQSTASDSQLTPAKLMQSASRELSKLINIRNIEPEPKYNKSNMVSPSITKESIENSSNLGNSKSRSAQQTSYGVLKGT